MPLNKLRQILWICQGKIESPIFSNNDLFDDFGQSLCWCVFYTIFVSILTTTTIMTLKKTLIITLILFFQYQLFSQNIPILFKANMNQQIALGKFNPASEFVDIAGTFNGWNGSLHRLTDEDEDRIYEITIEGFSAQTTIEFKFRINGEWNGREEFPGGGPNRKYTVKASNNVIEVWYNDELPLDAAPQANFSINMTEFYEDAIITYNDASIGNVDHWEWSFEGGVPVNSSEQNPVVSYPDPGKYGVSLIIGAGEKSDTLIFEEYVNVLERNTTDIPWWNHTVFYEIFVRSFYDSDGNGIGDFKGLIEKLDYLNDGDSTTTDDLGIGGIWLMPIHPSPSYHGYDVRDYRDVNAQYGGMEDFKEFLREAHARGIKVIIDFVMNHSSSAHPWFLNSASSPTADKRDWYRWSSSRPNYNGPWGQPVWHSRGGNYYYGLFWSGMPDLNYESEALKEEMFSSADFWLNEIGIDGFRLDAVKFIYEENQQLEDTEATFQFWRDFRTSYKASNPEAFAVGEAWTNTEKVTEYVKNEGLDYCFDFDLAWNIINAVNEEKTDELYEQVQKIYNVYPHLQYGTFLSNHDQDRIMNVFGNRADKVKVAAAIYLTLPGIPYIYYGEEIGMNGAKPDEFIRRPMQWNDGNAGGFTEGSPWIALNSNYRTVNVEDESNDSNSILNTYKSLIHLRNQEAALRVGTYEVVNTNGSGVLAFLRRYQNETILVIINTRSQAYSSLDLDLSKTDAQTGSYVVENLLASDQNFELQINSELSVEGIEIEGRSWQLFKLNQITDVDEIFSENQLHLYPNPTSNKLVVELPSFNLSRLSYEIFDLHGRSILKARQALINQRMELDVSILAKGTYIIRIVSGGFYANRKFVKD